MKIFRQQLIEAKVALSSLFVGTFSKVLPYANAILMVIKEVSKAIAMMFGIKLKDYNSGIASNDAYSDSIGEIGDSADKSNKKVKELKRQILGFDEIHNIDETKNNSSGSDSSGVSGGIDQRLLDAIKGYDNGMDKVRMKASEIRDKIMEWLGFTKEIDPLTGEVYFKYGGIKKTLTNMWKSFKGLSTEGKILVGLGLVIGATKLWNTGKKLVNIFGSSGLYKVIKSLYNPTTSLFSTMLTGLKGSHSSLKTGIQSWREQMGIINSTTGKVDGFKGALNGAKTAMAGLITGAIGLYTVHKSIKSISEEGTNLVNVLGLVGGSLTTIASGIQVGMVFGPWGAAIGGVTATVATLTTALLSYENQGYKTAESIKKSTKVTNEYSSSLLKQYNAISETAEKQKALTTAHSNMIDELESIVDANGKVKKGYEERAEFIVTTLNQAYGTELSITDGKIQKLDEEINKIRDVIAEKKKEIALESASQAYEIALKEKAKAYQNLEMATKNYNDAIINQERYESKLKDSYEKYKDSYYKQYETYEKFLDAMSRSEKGYKNIISATKEAKNSMDNATTAYDANTTAIMQYQGLLSADAKENSELVDYYMNQIENTYYDGKKTIKLTYDQQVKDAQEYYSSVIRTAKENGQEITDEIKSQAESRLNTVTQNLKEQSATVENITPQIVKAWATLGKQNKDKFLEKFKELPKDVQTEIVDKMQEKGYGISKELATGISQINPEIHVKSKVDKAKIEVDADTSKAKRKTNSWLSSLFSGIGKFLGLTTKANGGVYSNGTWKNIPQYANGGSPSHGTMFVAGEAGAEIVGHINGKTEVLNQSQIASAIYSAVYSAMSQFNGGGVAEINVHASKDVIVETAINGINQETKQTGICPVKFPM